MDYPLPASRAEAFPAGLRVLVVDDDPTWLKILEKMLRKCSYEVTTCGLARVALDTLRERKDRFDIVISDVNMPDMDGFKLLEHVGLEMDLPVIMMSIDGETSRVMKGVQHGACDYLLKPVRMKELRNIWQHVYRKRMHEVKEIEGHDINEELSIIRSGSEDFESRNFIGGDISSMRKRKDVDNKENSDQDINDTATVKKARVVWSVDLHQKFVNAVNQIGFDKVGPKKILDLMNVPGLTRENVASHLQKYRLYLSRLQKQKEGKNCGGNMPSDFSKKGLSGNSRLQNARSMQQETAPPSYATATQKVPSPGVAADIHLDEMKSIVPLQATDSKKVVKSNESSTNKVNSISQSGIVLSFKGMAPSAENKLPETAVLKTQSWNEGFPVTHFMQYPKHNHERCSLIGDYSCLPKPDQVHRDVGDHLQYSIPSVISIACKSEKDTTDLHELKPVLTDYISSCMTAIPSVTFDPVSVQVKQATDNSPDFVATCKLDGPPRTKDCFSDQTCNQGYLQLTHEPSIRSGIEIDLLPEDLHLFSLEGISCFEGVGTNSIHNFEDILTPVTEVGSNWYSGSDFNCEYLYDLVDYPIDEYLFA